MASKKECVRGALNADIRRSWLLKKHKHVLSFVDLNLP